MSFSFILFSSNSLKIQADMENKLAGWAGGKDLVSSLTIVLWLPISSRYDVEALVDLIWFIAQLFLQKFLRMTTHSSRKLPHIPPAPLKYLLLNLTN